MGISSPLDVQHTVLLALDCQAGLVSIYAKPPEEFVARAASVIQAARSAAMPIILVQVGFRPGLPEASERNTFVARLKANPQHQRLFQGDLGAIHPGLRATPEDIVVTKHRVSAFAGTDLEMILRSQEIDTLVLFGISTSGAVLSTLLDAFDADYRVLVIADCCADTDLELHDVLVRRMFPARGEVITASEFVEALGSQ
jgi:nicotinamidase-related amidase